MAKSLAVELEHCALESVGVVTPALVRQVEGAANVTLTLSNRIQCSVADMAHALL